MVPQLAAQSDDKQDQHGGPPQLVPQKPHLGHQKSLPGPPNVPLRVYRLMCAERFEIVKNEPTCRHAIVSALELAVLGSSPLSLNTL
ncbi:hypothetical protein GSUET_08510 [Geobacter sulfurreducens subsp. ethanolicus]|nr:hypothetical protein GSUET_08510 [Geobacter sulfurreducens subsp. ethanolicus]BET57123.1 hypothetical protein GEO60473_01630 [Geobacter sp. 60473]